jgi:hypothetical protein
MLRHRNEFPVEGKLPTFEGATAWINADPVTRESVQGRVVLVNFGTYTCINWLRSLPYVRAWADKYTSLGLAVVGVQTPEFGFEGDLDNVRRALKEMDVRYPVAVDNDYAIWEAFANHYWPALYFVDAQGRIRHHRYGEGEYEESEMVLQVLMREAGIDVGQGLVRVDADGVEAAADWDSLGSAETYVGYGRSQGFASVGGVVAEEPHMYTGPEELHRNQWALSGTWRVGEEGALLVEAGGSISYRFHARDLHLVMGPRSHQPPVRFRALLDGGPPGTAHGSDVDGDGYGRAEYQRIYQLVRQPGAVADRQLTVEFDDPGAEAFVFTFG